MVSATTSFRRKLRSHPEPDAEMGVRIAVTVIASEKSAIPRPLPTVRLSATAGFSLESVQDELQAVSLVTPGT